MKSEMREEVRLRLLTIRLAIDSAETYASIADDLFARRRVLFSATPPEPDIKGSIMSMMGLQIASLVLFCQTRPEVRGDGGSKIARLASGKGPVADVLRRADEAARVAVGLSKPDYDAFIRTLIDLRNRQIAHYDGRHADVRRENAAVTTMKGSFVAFRGEESRTYRTILRAQKDFFVQLFR